MLKFITEDYLKDLYRKGSFESYNLNSDERLTPGGRQYLLDKGIKINSNLPTDSNKSFKKEEVKENIKDNIKDKKLICEFKSLEVLFLKAASEILNNDLKLAQKVVDLGRYLKGAREFVEKKCELETINPKNCDVNFCEFEVTDIYMNLKNSKEIFNLYFLHCKLEEFKYEITLEYKEESYSEEILKNIIQIGNILSGMIKEEVGAR
ncbi:MAG: hypothetical protein RR620_11735 [Clostridium sp.]